MALAVTAAPARSGEETGDRFIKNARQLTYDGRRSGEGYFSPDGRYFIFQSERDPANPFYQIFMLDLETGDMHRVSPGTGKTTCSFFRPGTDRVLYASTHLDPNAEKEQKEELERRAQGKERRYAWDYDETFDIFSANRDGSDIKRLTEARGYDAEGGYSPDGKQIVFCSMRDAYSGELSKEDQERLKIDPSYFGEIYIMDADGSSQKRLTDWPGYDGGPFFSPDGTRIIWRHFTEDGAVADVYTMKLDGSERRRLTHFDSMCWAPYFHPSGKYVVFTTNKQGFSNFELYIVDAKGTKEPVRVTHTDGFDGLPVFSPDGKRLAWTSNRTPKKQSQLFMGQWDHEAALEALEKAPQRAVGDDEASIGDVGREALAGYDKAEFSPDISADDMRRMVTYLASDELEGRFTGTEGETLASEYIATYFQSIGLEPLGDDGTYFQSFPFTSGIHVVEDGNHMTVDVDGDSRPLEIDTDFTPLAFTDNAEVEGEVFFAGYGLTAPGEAEDAYNSYAGVDVTDKIVLVLRYVPEDVEMDRRQALNMYAGLRYKAMIARENGAKALLVAIGPNSPNAGELVPIMFDQSLASSGIPVAAITGEVAAMLFKNAENSLQDAQDGLDQENPHVLGHFDLPGVKIKLKTEVEREKSTGRNVVGYLSAPGGNDDAPVMLIGAHYDHIGHGEVGSLADKEHQKEIHNGADDNASGTSTMMEIAGALAAKRADDPDAIKYGLAFAAWSGEEIGIIGSNYFAENPPFPLDRVAAYMNFDMVGRLRDNSLVVRGIGSSEDWRGMIERRNVPAGFNLKLNDDPYLPTDVVSFYPKKVPVIDFFTGSHEYYNKPSDDAETLNYDDMQRVGKLALAIVMDVAGRDEPLAWVQVERSAETTGGRASLRAYLGTIPDYATSDIEGVKLTGVRAGGPADKAGMNGGDVIVEFGGKEIKNIYDYTYALDAVKIGEPVKMVVLRGGERVEITVVPEARK
jgi:Tol biopolymer transport system component/Zn-dependent M28 family amino/carboxypeptidase